MQIDWNQSLEGFRLIEIRNLLRTLGRSSFRAETIAERIREHRFGLCPAHVVERAQRLIDGLLISGLITVACTSTGPDRNLYTLTGLGACLLRASALKPMQRARADQAIAQFLSTIAEINADARYMHTITYAAIYGSYLSKGSRVGSLNIIYSVEPRWDLNNHPDFERRLEVHNEAFPPPDFCSDPFAFWPVRHIERRLKTHPFVQLERNGLLPSDPYRSLYPITFNVPAVPGWQDPGPDVILEAGSREEAQEEVNWAYAESLKIFKARRRNSDRRVRTNGELKAWRKLCCKGRATESSKRPARNIVAFRLKRAVG